MGIPVWVSRDLVQDIEQHSGIKTPEAPYDHVDNLLHDLDVKTQQSPVSISSISQQIKPETPEVKAQAVTKTAISIDNISRLSSEIGRTATHIVYACGNPEADWMIIGESPDISTNGQNQPYAGDSGLLLDNMLRAVGIERPREQAYLLNTLKTSMQDNENKELHSILLNKIQQVKPKMLLAVGQKSAQLLLNTQEPLARLRGKEHKLTDLQIPIVVTYYPSYLLSKPMDKRKAWQDLQLAMKILI